MQGLHLVVVLVQGQWVAFVWQEFLRKVDNVPRCLVGALKRATGSAIVAVGYI